MIVAGRNFGCGSSREQAASCLKGHELTIVARGFARIFLQNAINLGLKVVTAPGRSRPSEGDELEISPARSATGPPAAASPCALAAGAPGHHRRRRARRLHARPADPGALNEAALPRREGTVTETLIREDLRRSMEDILRTAIEREADSYDYYHDAAMDTDDAELRAFLLGLAETEKEHSRRLREELDRIENVPLAAVDGHLLIASAGRGGEGARRDAHRRAPRA